MAGDPGRAETLSAGASNSTLAGAIIAAWGGDATAVATLQARCAAQPLDTPIVYWCARLAGRAGDRVTQQRYRFWAAMTPSGADDGGAEVRVTTTQMVGRSLAGYPAIFWGTYTYRRFTPWDVLVPSLVHLTLQ